MTVLDLRSDLHGHVQDFVTARDRRWFEDHPGTRTYVRRAEAHELCIPTPGGMVCQPHAGRRIRVIDLGGVRARMFDQGTGA